MSSICGPGNDLLDAFANDDGATFVFRSGSGDHVELDPVEFGSAGG